MATLGATAGIIFCGRSNLGRQIKSDGPDLFFFKKKPTFTLRPPPSATAYCPHPVAASTPPLVAKPPPLPPCSSPRPCSMCHHPYSSPRPPPALLLVVPTPASRSKAGWGTARSKGGSIGVGAAEVDDDVGRGVGAAMRTGAAVLWTGARRRVLWRSMAMQAGEWEQRHGRVRRGRRRRGCSLNEGWRCWGRGRWQRNGRVKLGVFFF